MTDILCKALEVHLLFVFCLNMNIQSAIALQWLTWEEEERRVRIRHTGREREEKIAGM